MRQFPSHPGVDTGSATSPRVGPPETRNRQGREPWEHGSQAAPERRTQAGAPLQGPVHRWRPPCCPPWPPGDDPNPPPAHQRCPSGRRDAIRR